jgi:hypothetical protein
LFLLGAFTPENLISDAAAQINVLFGQNDAPIAARSAYCREI